MVAESANFAKVRVIFNLWAPGAFSFEEPAALSFKVLSSLGVLRVSVTLSPILYEGLSAYFSNIKVCAVFCTKNPLV